MELNDECSTENLSHPDASGDRIGIGNRPRYHQVLKEGDASVDGVCIRNKPANNEIITVKNGSQVSHLLRIGDDSRYRAAMKNRNKIPLNVIEDDFWTVKLEDSSSKDQKPHPKRPDIISEFQRHTDNIQSIMNEKIIDIVKVYEKRIEELEKDLEYYQKKHQKGAENEGFLSERSSLHRNQEKILKEYVKKVNLLETKLKLLELEKQSRVGAAKDSKVSPITSHHKLVDIDDCRKRQYSHNDRLNLQELYEALDVEDPDQLLPAVQKMKHDLNSMTKYKQFCSRMCSMVQQTHYNKTKDHEISSRCELSEDTLKYVLEMLSSFNEDIQKRQDLITCVNKMINTFIPWASVKFHSTDSLQEIVPRLQKICQSLVHITTMDETTSRQALEHLIHHFQVLFEVSSIEGIYPAMNQVYTKVGELQNIMKILKNLLGLDPSSKPSTVVDAVNEICQMHNATTSTQLKHLLQTEDLESIIKKLEEYDAFFPTFHAVMSEVLQILNVKSLSDVIPVVKTLVLMTF